jgi:hypothetical protein
LDKDEKFLLARIFPLSKNFDEKKFQIIASFCLQFSSNTPRIHFCSTELKNPIIMNFLKSYWFYILAAVITIIGIITGCYLLIIIAIRFGFFGKGNNGQNRP